MAKRRVPVGDDEVIRLYGELTNAPEVARRTGLGEGTIYRILERHGVRRTGVPRVPKFAPPHKLTPRQESEVARRYAEGERMAVLRSEFGCGAGLVREIARRHGVLVRGRGNRYRAFSDEQLQTMGQFWTSGVSQSRIASLMGISQSVVSNALRQAGVVVERRQTRGMAHGSWKGGRVVLGSRYIGVRVDLDDPYAVMRQRNGYVEEHRLVMARSLRRPLNDHETVHHINGDKADNRLENLQLRNGKHGTGVVMTCLNCGSHNIATQPLG